MEKKRQEELLRGARECNVCSARLGRDFARRLEDGSMMPGGGEMEMGTLALSISY